MQIMPAAVFAGAKNDEINHWIYEDFESSDITGINAVNASIRRESMQTYGNSNGSLFVSVTKNAGAPSFQTEMKNGVAYDISCRIKMKETPLSDKVQFVFQAPTADNTEKKAYNIVTASPAGLRAGQWTCVKTRYVCDGLGKLVGSASRVAIESIGTLDIRIGDGNIASTSPGGESIDYYLDDLVVLPSVKADDGNIITGGDFSDDTDLSAWTKSSGTSAVIESDTEQGSFARVTGKSNLSNLTQSVPVKFNTGYTLSFMLKTDDIKTVGKAVQVILDRSSSRTDTNIAKYQYLKDPDNPTVTSYWTRYTINYRYDIDTADTEAFPKIYIRVGSSSASEVISYCLDDVKFIPDGAVAENPVTIAAKGTFEIGSEITADIAADGAVKGFIVSVSRFSGGEGAIVYSDTISGNSFTYTIDDYDKNSCLIFEAYAVSSDGEIVGHASEKSPEIYGVASATAEFTDSVWTAAQNTLSARALVSGGGKEKLDAEAVAALYDADGVMKSAVISRRSFEASETGEIKLEIKAVPEAAYARLFVWNGKTQQPLTDASELKRLDADRVIYVDGENGSDSADGSAAAPLKTVEQAKSAAAAADGDVYVMLKGGEYKLSAALSFTGTNFSKESNITFASYDGRACLSGAVKAEGWSLYDGDKNIYRAYVGTDKNFRQIYVNDVRGVRARSKGGLTNAVMTDTGYTSSDTELLNYQRPQELEMVYYIKWANSRCMADKITESGGKTVITMNAAGWKKVQNKGQTSVSKAYLPAYYENAYELLDEPGEWYFNKGDGYLYYIPRFFEDMGTADVEVPILEKLVTIRGTADKNAQNITFRDIDFKYSTWNAPTTNKYLADTQNNHQNGVTGALPDAALELSYVNNVDFTGCTFSKLGITAMKLTEGVKSCDITSNEFYDISGSAISLGVPSGDYSKYINPTDERYMVRGNSIKDNYIHHTGVDYQSAAAVSAAFPKDTEISSNEIYDNAYSGLHLGMGWANYERNGTATENFNVKNNYIHNVLNGKLYDGAAIYTIGNTSGNGYNMISENYIKDVKNMYAALYPDEGSQYWEFSSNVADLSAYPLGYGAGGSKGTPIKWLHLWTNSIKNNRIVNNYSTTAECRNDGVQNVVEEPVICTSGAWPEEAQRIISSAGILQATALKFKRGLQDVEAMTDYSAVAGDDIALSITAKGSGGEAYDYRYSDIYIQLSDPTVASMDKNFRGKALAAGVTEIKAAIVEKGILKEFTMSLEVS